MKKIVLSFLSIVILLAGLPMNFVSATESPKAKAAVEPGRKQYVPETEAQPTEDDLISDDELEEISQAKWDKLPTVEADGTIGPVPEGPVVRAQRFSKILKLLTEPFVKVEKTKKGKTKRYTEKHTNNGNKFIHIKNGKLAGQKHPVTKVPFSSQGFPIFSARASMTLPLKELKSSNYTQFKLANIALKKQVNRNITLMGKFSKKQLKQIDKGETPEGYTWHHHQKVGHMQLVDTWKHEKTGHTGGRSIWGSIK